MRAGKRRSRSVEAEGNDRPRVSSLVTDEYPRKTGPKSEFHQAVRAAVVKENPADTHDFPLSDGVVEPETRFGNAALRFAGELTIPVK